MGKIKILGQDIASKIAAGEVIERPVSVVKELVENSIDAGSRNIIIEIEDGGKKSIKVIDDGEGMSADDVKLAFERHATSKIEKIDDIFNINTLGFRGEALASIAAVSELTLQTKVREESVGTLCKICGGTIEEMGQVATKDGCLIEVRNLFFNTPARLKFLSNNTHESSRITDLISRLAIGNIDISFRLIIDGKEVFYSSGNGDYREVIAKIYGVKLAREAIQFEKYFDGGKIWGFISTPSFNRGNRSGQTYFVNGRFIKDSSLSSCLERAYKTMLPIKRFPISIIFIDVDSSKVDVNVHPTKMEIKFQNQSQVHQALFQGVNESLRKHVLIPKETFDNSNFKSEVKNTTQLSQLELNSEIITKDVYNSNNYSKIYDSGEISYTELIKESPVIKNKVNIEESHETMPSSKQETFFKKFEYNRILGQLFNTYIVVEGKDEFYLIDQHAAHERILYELYSNRFTKPPQSQNLVAPQVLNFSAQEMMLIEYYKEDILKLGFDFSVFGTDSILVRAVPYIFNKPVDPTALRDALDQINQYDQFPEKDRFIMSMACHSAIRAGDALSQMEMNELIKQLAEIQGPYTCPHGRPTIISMTLTELEKKFKRI